MAEYRCFEWRGDAKKVFICASFTEWQREPLQKIPSPSRFFKSYRLPLGIHSYLFFVDGECQNDPMNELINEEDGYNQVEVLPKLPPHIPRSIRGLPTVQLFLKFNPSVKNCVRDCICESGYAKKLISVIVLDKSIVHACALLLGKISQDNAISELNDIPIRDGHKLQVLPFQRVPPSRVVTAMPQSTASTLCRLKVGPQFPEYIIKQHIEEHFAIFRSFIQEIHDQRLQRENHSFTVTFLSLDNAEEAVAAFNNSLLKGIQITVSIDIISSPIVEQHRLTVPEVSMRVNRNEVVSSSARLQSLTSDSAEESCSLFVYSKPRFPNFVLDEDLMEHFRAFHPIDAFIIRKKGDSTGLGKVTFCSKAIAEDVMAKMESTKVLKVYSITLKLEDLSRPPRSNKRQRPYKTGDDNRPHPHHSIPKESPSSFFTLSQRSSSELSQVNPLAGYSQHCGALEQPTSKPLNSSQQLGTQSFSGHHTAQLVASQASYPSAATSLSCMIDKEASFHFGALEQPTSKPLNSAQQLGIYSAQSFSGHRTAQLAASQASYPSAATSLSCRAEMIDKEASFHFSCSIKVSHLSHTVTMEKLRYLFERFGELDGDPVLHEGKIPYAHVNFKSQEAAQKALQLNNTKFEGCVITLKKARSLSGPQGKGLHSSKSHTETEERTSKIMELLPSEWNQLVTTDEVTGLTLLDEVMTPYLDNPNVTIQLLLEKKALKFTGKKETVESSYEYVAKHIKRDLTIDRSE